MTLQKGHKSTKGDNPDLKKNTDQLIIDGESVKFKNPNLMFVRMDKP